MDNDLIYDGFYHLFHVETNLYQEEGGRVKYTRTMKYTAIDGPNAGRVKVVKDVIDVSTGRLEDSVTVIIDDQEEN